MKKTIIRVVSLVLSLAMLAIASPTSVNADGNADMGEQTDEEYVTVPFEVSDEVITTQKPKVEDLASRFLKIDKGVEENFSASFINALKLSFNTTYPKLADYFNYGIMYDTVYISDPETQVAYATVGTGRFGKLIAMNPTWYKSNRNDVGSILHELTHTLQGYVDDKYGATPSAEGGNWNCEGIADWSRYTYDRKGAFALYEYNSSVSYTNSYRDTARFFEWLNQNYDPTFTQQLHEALKCEAYTSKIYVKITGKTIDELWEIYAKSDHKI